MTSPSPCRASTAKGFSLIELLVVVAIIGVLSVFSLVAFDNVVRAGRVEQAVGTVAGLIEMARLEAGAKSRPVEIRFYQPQAGSHYHALQLFLLTDDGMAPLTPVTRLPEGVRIAQDAKSSLLAASDLKSGTGDTGVAQGWPYESFEIASDGETSLTPSGGPYYLAIGPERVLDRSDGEAIGVLAVFVDAVTGKTRVAGK